MSSNKKHPNHHKTIHQHIEELMRHRVMLIAVLSLMGMAYVKMDTRVAQVMQQAYSHGFGWIGTYMHHEHPAHAHSNVGVARIPTISSG